MDRQSAGIRVLVGDSLVALKDFKDRRKSKDIYKALIRDMVLDRLVRKKIEEKKLDKRESMKHVLKHIEEEVSLNELHTEMHKGKIPVDAVEIEGYYTQNRERYGNRSLREVRDEIRGILVSQKERRYVEEYIEQLKESAVITKNDQLLRVPEPTEEEARQYYEDHRDEFQQPASVLLDQMRMADRKRAQKASARLSSGEDFGAVAAEMAEDSTFSTVEYVEGQRGKAFDEAISSLSPGEISRPIQDAGTFYIVRVKEKIPARALPFQQVQGLVRRLMADEREREKYERNKNKTLFTLHGRRYTLGEFYQEYSELSASEQEKYRSYEERTRLVDRMIERLLLLEDSYDRMLNVQNREEIEHIREDILRREFHREEVDEKISISEEELRAYYQETRSRHKTPPRAQISRIVVNRRRGKEEENRAKKKIEEAYERIASGELSFEEAARTYSEDPETGPRGGMVASWIAESGDPFYEMLSHGFHQRIFNLKEGEVSKPFVFGHAYYIVKVRAKEEDRELSFEEVKSHLEEDLRMKKHEELTAQMFQDLLEQANLVIYDSVVKTMLMEKSATEPQSSQRTP